MLEYTGTMTFQSQSSGKMAPKGKTLRELGLAIPATPNLRILGLSSESGGVRGGYLFAALPGTNAHGAEFARQAIERGAAAILTDRAGSEIIVGNSDLRRLPIIEDPNPRSRLAVAASRFFGIVPKRVVAVTGTNGKTSVATMCRQIWESLGKQAANVGTTGAEGAFLETLRHTTPDPIKLHSLLHRMAKAGVSHVALEASSHGLHQRRLDGLQVGAAAFTNLTHEHLDYHEGLDDYFAAKMTLFERVLSPSGIAVVCKNGQFSSRAIEIAKSRNIDVLTVGGTRSDLQLLSQRYFKFGQELRFAWHGETYVSELGLVGGIQALNLLTAAALVIGTGEDPKRVFDTFQKIVTVTGRLDVVATRDNNSVILVDYAHTPAALETVLRELRPHFGGRLLLVFGAGGDRDKEKRPLMGKAAFRLADLIFVTDDNPRQEDASLIRQQILDKCPGAIEIGDRAEAILVAASELRPGDALLIAGKGHETGQIIGNSVIPFNDAEQASVSARLLDGKKV